jgi:hypothetical protein
MGNVYLTISGTFLLSLEAKYPYMLIWNGDLGSIHKELTLIYLKALVQHWSGMDTSNQLQQLSVSEAVAVYLRNIGFL